MDQVVFVFHDCPFVSCPHWIEKLESLFVSDTWFNALQSAKIQHVTHVIFINPTQSLPQPFVSDRLISGTLPCPQVPAASTILKRLSTSSRRRTQKLPSTSRTRSGRSSQRSKSRRLRSSRRDALEVVPDVRPTRTQPGPQNQIR